jgi:hypothetical protein
MGTLGRRGLWAPPRFVRNVDKIDYDDPVNAVIGRPVFEIFSTTTPPTSESRN